MDKLIQLLSEKGFSIKPAKSGHSKNNVYILVENSAEGLRNNKIATDHFADIEREGYKIIRDQQDVYVIGIHEKGVLYGIMDLMDQLAVNPDFAQLTAKQVNPAMEFRAIKFNLPWSPYRPGPATALHLETCRDINFWESFLDMMVKNRFNALTLWNTHPFPYLIRANNYPKATGLDDQQLVEWRSFWKSLFKMAKNRGIETYLVNWNIVVSPEFAAAYGVKEYSDTSQLVKTYTRESVTQLIDEYDDLTGLGVTLADWMGNWGEFKMSSSQREQWIEDTFVQGIKDAKRKVKFIHRAVLAGDPGEMRRVIDGANLPDKTIVEIKFNWSHGHSTPNLSLTHANDHGTVMQDFWDPIPENYFIAWMIRNEDFFVLRWGEPEFIRQHINTNLQNYVDGYLVGSEGYIPAKDYSYMPNHPHKTWKYAFEKQWLFYHLWGRLMFNPEETDQVLSQEISNRYPGVDAAKLLNAYKLASKVPLYIASFYKGTWDFTLYSEGFLAPWPNGFDDQKSPFISIEELIRHETLDPRYLSIAEYCRTNGHQISDQRITPVELAETIRGNSNYALALIGALRSTDNEPALISELDDLETWCQIGSYFADKIMAGISLTNFLENGDQSDKARSITYLERCLGHWKNIVDLTKDRYQPMPYVSMGHHLNPGANNRWPEFTSFHWSNFLKDVEADIDYVKAIE
ncbi:MAG: hypothetical protein DHS20C17_26830 [Cyclobacteriaceae bacterium]|nr:MAG: hypothetical protein DHS20C17_26830 [Cyclobacteriaceae bacterium]